MTRTCEANKAAAVQTALKIEQVYWKRWFHRAGPFLLLLCLWIAFADAQSSHQTASLAPDVDPVSPSDAAASSPSIDPQKAAPMPAKREVQARESQPVADTHVATHLVRQGETLSAIAVHYGVGLDALVLYNRLSDPNRIQTGMILSVPLSKLIVEWPVIGVVTSPYGQRQGRLHAGIDIAALQGTPVYAAASGRVITSGVQRGYGRIIELRHQAGYVTVYAHHDENLVEVGQRVRRGQLIARVGMSGRATGPHLHFEIRQATRSQDPALYLPPPIGLPNPMALSSVPASI